MKICKALILLLLPFFCVSCGNTHVNPDWQAKIGPQKFYAEPYVKRSSPFFSVVPARPSQSSLKAIMFSFDLKQDIDYPQKIGRELGKIFYKHWVRMQVFPQLVYERKRPFPGKEKALEYAKEKGIELVIRGKIKNYFFSGSQGTTRLNIQVDIYNVSNKMLIWSMEHAGIIENSPEQDYIFWKREVRMPQSPAYLILSVLARDLAKPVKRWSQGKKWGEEKKDLGAEKKDWKGNIKEF